jgi:hypothetical protein
MQRRDSNKNHNDKEELKMEESSKKVYESQGENTSIEDRWLELYHSVTPWCNFDSAESKLVFVFPEGKTIELSILIKEDTITDAGYEALEFGLKVAERMSKRLRILSNSELFNRQSTNEDDHLRTLRDGVINQLEKFDCYEVLYFPMGETQEFFRVVLTKTSLLHG